MIFPSAPIHYLLSTLQTPNLLITLIKTFLTNVGYNLKAPDYFKNYFCKKNKSYNFLKTLCFLSFLIFPFLFYFFGHIDVFGVGYIPEVMEHVRMRFEKETKFQVNFGKPIKVG